MLKNMSSQPEQAVPMYAVLDDQSNRFLPQPDFFELFNVRGGAVPYTLKTCSGIVEMAGRRATNFAIESTDGQVRLTLPTLVECDMLPDDRTEIPTPEVTRHHEHLRLVADKIPPLNPKAQILILLGRDILRVHKVR